jgi:hypothetical protein
MQNVIGVGRNNLFISSKDSVQLEVIQQQVDGIARDVALLKSESQ